MDRDYKDKLVQTVALHRKKTEDFDMPQKIGSSAPMWLGRTPAKITVSRHELTRSRHPDSHSNDTKKSPRSSSILIRKTQDESLRSSFASTDLLTCTSEPSLMQNSTWGARDSAKSFASTASMNSNVSFGTVSIREYPRCVGDNPSVNLGPPMTLEWDHQHYEECAVNAFEKNRDSSSKKVKRLKGKERIDLLAFEWKATLDEILEASKQTRIIREQRTETMMAPPLQERIEEIMESAGRSLKKVFNKKKKREKGKNEKKNVQ